MYFSTFLFFLFEKFETRCVCVHFVRRFILAARLFVSLSQRLPFACPMSISITIRCESMNCGQNDDIMPCDR